MDYVLSFKRLLLILVGFIISKTSAVDYFFQRDANYFSQFSNLEVEFPGNNKVQLGKYLGHGGSLVTFEYKDKYVIQINSWFFKDDGIRLDSTESKLAGYRKLKNSKIPLARINERLSRPKDYIIAEKINNLFSLEEWLKNKPHTRSFSDEELISSLIAFARTTAPFKEIGDFYADQIIWNGETWVLLDWDNLGTVRAKNVEDGIVWDVMRIYGYKKLLPTNLYNKIKKSISKERKKMFINKCNAELTRTRK